MLPRPSPSVDSGVWSPRHVFHVSTGECGGLHLPMTMARMQVAHDDSTLLSSFVEESQTVLESSSEGSFVVRC